MLRHDAAQYVKLVRHLPDVFRLLAGIVKSSGAGSDAGPSPLRRNFSFGPKTPLIATMPISSSPMCPARR
ncbi:MAG: hypothetical protein C0522_14665 [Rhodocyclaceae bacterium]|jgi:hypothetical protein|nr:hypothetical protein [Rhodocyclaceae bacterium]